MEKGIFILKHLRITKAMRNWGRRRRARQTPGVSGATRWAGPAGAVLLHRSHSQEACFGRAVPRSRLQGHGHVALHGGSCCTRGCPPFARAASSWPNSCALRRLRWQEGRPLEARQPLGGCSRVTPSRRRRARGCPGAARPSTRGRTAAGRALTHSGRLRAAGHVTPRPRQHLTPGRGRPRARVRRGERGPELSARARRPPGPIPTGTGHGRSGAAPPRPPLAGRLRPPLPGRHRPPGARPAPPAGSGSPRAVWCSRGDAPSLPAGSPPPGAPVPPGSGTHTVRRAPQQPLRLRPGQGGHPGAVRGPGLLLRARGAARGLPHGAALVLLPAQLPELPAGQPDRHRHRLHGQPDPRRPHLLPQGHPHPAAGRAAGDGEPAALHDQRPRQPALRGALADPACPWPGDVPALPRGVLRGALRGAGAAAAGRPGAAGHGGGAAVLRRPVPAAVHRAAVPAPRRPRRAPGAAPARHQLDQGHPLEPGHGAHARREPVRVPPFLPGAGGRGAGPRGLPAEQQRHGRGPAAQPRPQLEGHRRDPGRVHLPGPGARERGAAVPGGRRPPLHAAVLGPRLPPLPLGLPVHRRHPPGGGEHDPGPLPPGRPVE